MLTPQEEEFIRSWEQNRLRKKSIIRQLAVGLPLGAAIVVFIFFNVLSGWYKRAEMQLRANQFSSIIVVLIAAILIVIFITIFSARHKWDINETRYKELKARKSK